MSKAKSSPTAVKAPLTEEEKKNLKSIHDAIIVGDTETLEQLLKKPAVASVVNEIDQNGFAALHRVTHKPEQLSMLNMLLKVSTIGIEVDVIGLDKETPLFMAVRSNNVNAAQDLIKAGATVNIMCGLTQNTVETPLHCAAKCGYEKMTTLLMQHKAEINARDGWRQTPMIVAAKNDRPMIIYMLLTAGATPQPLDADGKDALYVASENRHEYCVTLLKSDRKHLKNALSEIKAEMKIAKPSVHSSEQLASMIAEHSSTEAKSDLKAKSENKEGESAAAASSSKSETQPPEKTNVVAQSSPVVVVNTKSPASAAAAAPTPSVSSSNNNNNNAPVTTTTAPVVPVPTVTPMAIRTHDPLTGKKLPPCKTLDEVGPDEARVIPAGVVKDFPDVVEFQKEHGGTKMVVGAGLPGEMVEKPKAKPLMFVNSFGVSDSE